MTVGDNGGTGWKTAQLGDVIQLFDSQRVPLNSRERQQRQGQYPYYGAQGIIDHIDGYIFDGRYILVAEDGENLNSKKLPLALFASGKFWVNNHAHILRGRPDVIDDTFLLACLNNADIRPFVTGAAQPKLSQASLRRIDVPLPPLSVQRRIAGVLSAYDDLIENDLRRIGILEEMARRLYREWFVEFRVPGREEIPRVASPFGDIPQGWEATRLDEVCLSVQDGDWVETKDQGGNDYRLLQISNIGVGEFIETGNLRFVTQATFERLRCTEIIPGDVLVARMPTPIGRAWLATAMPWRMITAVDVAIVRTQRDVLHPLFLAQAWNEPFNLQRIAAQASGTTRLRITRRELASLEFVVPPIAIQMRFADCVAPHAEMIQVLRGQAENLRRTRDLLLPRLLSGQVELDAV